MAIPRDKVDIKNFAATYTILKKAREKLAEKETSVSTETTALLGKFDSAMQDIEEQYAQHSKAVMYDLSYSAEPMAFACKFANYRPHDSMFGRMERLLHAEDKNGSGPDLAALLKALVIQIRYRGTTMNVPRLQDGKDESIKTFTLWLPDVLNKCTNNFFLGMANAIEIECHLDERIAFIYPNHPVYKPGLVSRDPIRSWPIDHTPVNYEFTRPLAGYNSKETAAAMKEHAKQWLVYGKKHKATVSGAEFILHKGKDAQVAEDYPPLYDTEEEFERFWEDLYPRLAAYLQQDAPVGSVKRMNTEFTDEELSFLGRAVCPVPHIHFIRELMVEMSRRLALFVYKGANPIFIAAFVHNAFVSIHPRTDENGRTARVMTTYILTAFGLFPMIGKDQTYINAVTVDSASSVRSDMPSRMMVNVYNMMRYLLELQRKPFCFFCGNKDILESLLSGNYTDEHRLFVMNNRPILFCSACGLVSYCSAECQKKDRKEHRNFCNDNAANKEKLTKCRNKWKEQAENALLGKKKLGRLSILA